MLIYLGALVISRSATRALSNLCTGSRLSVTMCVLRDPQLGEMLRVYVDVQRPIRSPLLSRVSHSPHDGKCFSDVNFQ